MEKFGQKIKRLRLFLDLTQVEFANSIDITQGALSKIEKSGDIISVEILKKIAKIHKVSLDWLVLGEGLPPIKETKGKKQLIKELKALGKESFVA